MPGNIIETTVRTEPDFVPAEFLPGHFLHSGAGAAMKRRLLALGVLADVGVLKGAAAGARQPSAASDPDISLGHRHRGFSAQQFSNTVSSPDNLCRCN
jgi:hypothetical protein